MFHKTNLLVLYTSRSHILFGIRVVGFCLNILGNSKYE